MLIYNTFGGTDLADDQLRGAWDTPRVSDDTLSQGFIFFGSCEPLSVCCTSICEQRWATVIGYCGASASGEEGAVGNDVKTWVAKRGAAESGGARLLGLQVLIRHGDRSSIHWLTQDVPPFSCAFTDEDAIKVIIVRVFTASASFLSDRTLPMQAIAGFDRFKILGAQGKAKPETLMPRVVHSEDPTQERCFPGQLTERGLLQHLATGR